MLVSGLVQHKPGCTTTKIDGRGLKFQILEVEGLYYPCSENKGADQLRDYREADLRLCFAYAKCLFSHDAAHVFYYYFLFYVHSKQLWSFWCQELILSPLIDNK